MVWEGLQVQRLCARSLDWEVISRALGHLKPEGKTNETALRRTYNTHDRIDTKERRAALTNWHYVLIKQGWVIWIPFEARSLFFMNLIWLSDWFPPKANRRGGICQPWLAAWLCSSTIRVRRAISFMRSTPPWGSSIKQGAVVIGLLWTPEVG